MNGPRSERRREPTAEADQISESRARRARGRCEESAAGEAGDDLCEAIVDAVLDDHVVEAPAFAALDEDVSDLVDVADDHGR